MRGKLLIFLLLFVLTIPLTACSPQEDPWAQAGKEQTSGPSPETDRPIEEKVYEGKIEEAKIYLREAGLDPLDPITQSPEGNERIVTWEDLATRQEAMLLDAFLERSIQKISAEKAYGPVNLRTVAFHLEKNRLAEVYFYEDKILGGVTYPEEGQDKSDYRSIQGETLAQIRNIDFPVWQAGQSQPKDPSIFYLHPQQATQDGFEQVFQVFSLGYGKTLIVLKNDVEIRAYVYDLKTGVDFYTGISTREDYLPLRVKPLQANQVAVLLQDRMIIVNREDFQVVREINYPEEVALDDIDISLDGQIIVSAGKRGLTVYDGNFATGKTIVPSKIGTDPNGIDTQAPRYPVLSPDSSHILYRTYGYEWLVGTGTIALDGSDHRYFTADQVETTFVRWYDNAHIYSNGSPYVESDNPVLRNISTGEETPLIKEAPKDKNLRYFQGKNQQFLFTLETLLDENYNLETVKLGYYDLSKGMWHSLMESNALRHLDWYPLTYDSQENVFVFALSNDPLASRPAILTGLP